MQRRGQVLLGLARIPAFRGLLLVRAFRVHATRFVPLLFQKHESVRLHEGPDRFHEGPGLLHEGFDRLHEGLARFLWILEVLDLYLRHWGYFSGHLDSEVREFQGYQWS